LNGAACEVEAEDGLFMWVETRVAERSGAEIGLVAEEGGIAKAAVFRFNRRRLRSRGLLFQRLLAQAAAGEAVIYDQLRKAGRTRPAPPPPTRGAVPAAEPLPRPCQGAPAMIRSRLAFRR